MDHFVVSFRKYRPDTFSSVIGQSHITDTLKNAIRTQQLAQAFLFCGPRGVGKTTCARILAKAVNCKQLTPEGDPCNVCVSCKAFNDGRSVTIHEMDAASNNGVDDIRNLIEQVRYIPPLDARAVYIIDEVHMLTASAFNAFLKTLEEPPPHAIFILATTEKHKILPTILSRCQKFDFRRIKIQDMANHLAEIAKKENITFELPALQLIALKADGALRDALSFFDQVSTFANRNITFEATLENLNILDYDYYFRIQEAISSRDHAKALLIYQEIINKGFDAYNFISGMLHHYRNLLMASEPRTLELLQTSDNVRKKYLNAASSLNETFLLNAFQLCSDTELKYKSSANPHLLIELLLIKLVYLEDAIHLAGQKSGAPDGEPEEKKKPDSEELKIHASQASSADTSSSKTLTQEIPVAKTHSNALPIESPQVNEPSVAFSEKANARVLTLPSNIGNSRFSSIPKSLNHLSEQIADEKDENPDEDIELPEYAIAIDEEKFRGVYTQICDELEQRHKMFLATELRKGNWSLEVAYWIQKVSDPVQKMMLEEEKNTLVERVRVLLNHPGVRMRIEQVAPDENATKSKIPYTADERLRYLEGKYPFLKEFIQRHQAQVSYS